MEKDTKERKEQEEKREARENPETPEEAGRAEEYEFDFGGQNEAPRQEAASGGRVPPEVYERRRAISAGEPAKKRKVGKTVACVAGGIGIAAIGFFAGYFTYSATLDGELKSLAWVKDRIQESYYEEITDEEFYDAVFGAVNGLLDPYSSYLSAEQYADMLEEATGQWSGVGLSFSTREIEQNDRMLIVRVSGNSPAERAGIREGMYLVGFGTSQSEIVESSSYAAFTEFTAARATGEPFVLLLEDVTGGERSYATVSKESFVENYVFYRSDDSAYIFTGENATELTPDDNVLAALDAETAYIRLTQFNGEAKAQFTSAMDVFRSEGKTNLILDLRANGGGYLDILCDIASYFCKDSDAANPVVATAEYRGGRKQTFSATGNRYDEYFSSDSRIVVMADNGTASASECLIGAMKDYGAVGYEDIWLSTRNGETKTYGKGIMQTTLPHLFAGDAVTLTTAYIYWPVSGNCIHGRGVLPEDGAHTVAENYERDAELSAVIAEAGFSVG